MSDVCGNGSWRFYNGPKVCIGQAALAHVFVCAWSRFSIATLPYVAVWSAVVKRLPCQCIHSELSIKTLWCLPLRRPSAARGVLLAFAAPSNYRLGPNGPTNRRRCWGYYGSQVDSVSAAENWPVGGWAWSPWTVTQMQLIQGSVGGRPLCCVV